MHKFKNAIDVVKEHLDSRVSLVVPPDLHLEDTIEDSAANDKLVQQVEELCAGWFEQVSLNSNFRANFSAIA